MISQCFIKLVSQNYSNEKIFFTETLILRLTMKIFISRTIVFLIAFTFTMGGALQFASIDLLSPETAEAKKNRDKDKDKDRDKGKDKDKDRDKGKDKDKDKDKDKGKDRDKGKDKDKKRGKSKGKGKGKKKGHDK